MSQRFKGQADPSPAGLRWRRAHLDSEKAAERFMSKASLTLCGFLLVFLGGGAFVRTLPVWLRTRDGVEAPVLEFGIVALTILVGSPVATAVWASIGATALVVVAGRISLWLRWRARDKLFPTSTDKATLLSLGEATEGPWLALSISLLRTWWWAFLCTIAFVLVVVFVWAGVIPWPGTEVQREPDARLMMSPSSVVVAVAIFYASFGMLKGLKKKRMLPGWTTQFEARYALYVFARMVMEATTAILVGLVCWNIIIFGAVQVNDIAGTIMERQYRTFHTKIHRIIAIEEPDATTERAQHLQGQLQALDEFYRLYRAEGYAEVAGWLRNTDVLVVPFFLAPAMLAFQLVVFGYFLAWIAWLGRGRLLLIVGLGIAFGLLETAALRIASRFIGAIGPGIVVSTALVTLSLVFIIIPEYLKDLVVGPTTRCASCGAESQASARHCTSCGKELRHS